MNLAGRRYGHIRVDRMLGQGGMGEVYEGFDERLARRVALKVLNREGQLDEEARARLIREARTLSKLDHPNICRIHDFIDDGANDVLVLELIDGRTLQEAMNDGLSSADKLRIARDIADVLVAAHRAGVIHRDLKPDNVMLTKSGQVKVLDFGLARWLKRKSGKSFPAIPAIPEPRLRPTASHPETTVILDPPARPAVDELAANATTVGLTVGTPLFMSPEQARGEPLTTASDIYSFGLMLQAMFTGKDPYPPELNAREIMIRASRGDSLPVNGVRRDVAALIKTFKALAPSDRPTAGDALRRINRIIDTPKRIARRAAVAALVALIVFAGWKYTVDLRRERAAAQKAEVEAKRSRADADGLIGFMLGDLRTKLDPVGKLDILDDVGERALAYMSSLDPKTLTAEELGRNSKALYQLGEVRIGQGRLTEATKVLVQSLALAKTAADREPKNEKLRLALGTAHFWLGKAVQSAGDFHRALDEYTAYLTISEKLAVEHPSNLDYQRERAYGHGNVGTILEAEGRLTDALSHYDVALALKRDLLNHNPADNGLRADLAMATNKIGVAQYKLGDLTGARRRFEDEIAVHRQLLAVDAKQTRWQEREAVAHAYLARVLEDLGLPDDALRELHEELQIEQRLATIDPANASWARNRAVTTMRIGNATRLRGDASGALGYFAASETLFADLLKRDSARKSWQRDRAGMQTAYARALAAAGSTKAALAKAETARRALEALPLDDLNTRVQLADNLVVDGDLQAAAGATVRAREFWNRADQLLSPMVAASGEPRLLDNRIHALLGLGRSGEAHRIAERLKGMGYISPDFVTLCLREHC